jgi:hypothetical protein
MRNLALLLWVFGNGCVSEQYSEFRGVFSRGGAAELTPAVQPLGGDFAFREKESADALIGFSLPKPGGQIVFVCDREKLEKNEYRLSGKVLKGVYLADWVWENWISKSKDFLRLDEDGRQRMEGVQRLSGQLEVKRWRSNVDFLIRLSMYSDSPPAVKLDGILTTYNRLEFHPMQWIAVIGMGTGLARPPKPPHEISEPGAWQAPQIPPIE